MHDVCKVLRDRQQRLELTLGLIKRDKDRIYAELLKRNEEALKVRYKAIATIKAILDKVPLANKKERAYISASYDRVVRKYLYYRARHEAMEKGLSPDDYDIKKFLDSLALLKD